jgi:hypothetical protein
MIKLRIMRWVGYVARMGDMRNAYNILAGKPEGMRPLEDLRVDDKIILERVFGK